MGRKAAERGFIEDLLGRLDADRDTSSFHASAFKHTFDGIKARFRDLK